MSEFSNFLVLDLEYKNLVLNLQDNKNDKKKKKKKIHVLLPVYDPLTWLSRPKKCDLLLRYRKLSSPFSKHLTLSRASRR